MEQRARDLINRSTTDEHDCFPPPIEPSHCNSFKDQGNDLILTVAIREITLHSLFFDHQRYQLQLLLKHQILVHLHHSKPNFPSRHLEDLFDTIQPFIRNSAKLRPKEPKYNHSQPNHPVLVAYWEPSPDRTKNIDCFYNIFTPFINFILNATSFSTARTTNRPPFWR